MNEENEELERLIKEAKLKLDNMTKEEKEAMWKSQKEGYVKAEMSWPKVNKQMVNGVLIYDNLKDYYND